MQCENDVGDCKSPALSRQEIGSATVRSPRLTLAQPTRLAIFRLLIKHEPIGITAGVIADTVGRQYLVDSWLFWCGRACCSSREGRTIIYRSDVDGMQSLLSFLVNDCCDGHPELCNLGATAPKASCCAPAPAKAVSRRKAVPAARPRKRAR
jgi:hypothetical protein